MPQDNSVFDVSKPANVGAAPTSRPVIAGHRPIMPDPMVRETRAEPVEFKSPPRTIAVQSEPAPAPTQPAPVNEVPSLGNLSGPLTQPVGGPGPAAETAGPVAMMEGEPLQSPPFEPDGKEVNHKPGSPYMPISSLTGIDPSVPASSLSDIDALAKDPEPKEAKVVSSDQSPLEFPTGTKSRKHFNYLWLLIALAILAVVYLALDSRLIPNNLNLPLKIFKHTNSTSQAAPATQVSQSPGVAQVPAGWTIYQNKDFGLSFAYPTEWGQLAPSQTNANMLQRLTTANQRIEAQSIAGMLSFTVWKKDATTISTAKYGPSVKPVMSGSDTNWVVTAPGTSQLYSQKAGDKYPVQSQKLNSLTIYNFSYSDEGCAISRWVVELKNGYAELSLPGLCSFGSVSTPIPAANQQTYTKLSSNFVGSFSIPAN